MNAFDEQFEIVAALHQEAEMMRPHNAEPTSHQQAAPSHAHSSQPIQSHPVIQARPARKKKTKPAAATASLDIFNRIDALHAESEALRDNGALPSAPEDNTPAITEDDDFIMPSTFGASDAPSDTRKDDAAVDEALADDALADALLAEADTLSEADRPAPADTDISAADAQDIEGIGLDDPLGDMALINELSAPHEAPQDETPPNEDMLDEGILDEALADAQIEAAGAPTDAVSQDEPQDEISQQLDDVRQAVESAQKNLDKAPIDTAEEHKAEAPIAAGEPEETSSDEGASDETLLRVGPELAQFIGETVRDVLDEELPSMVRGIVNETLNERGPSSRASAGTQLGLRTKSTISYQ